MILLLVFIIMFVLMGLGLEVFISMGISSIIYLLLQEIPLTLIAERMVGGISYSFLAIPFFMLAGELMNVSGITKKLTKFALFFVGHLKGGLAYVAVIVNLISAGVSGSAPADASAVSSVLLPAMEEENYKPDFAAAINGASATIGPIFPPSIPMVFLGLITELSVGRLFLGGVIPGILMAGTLMIMVFIKVRKISLKNSKIKIERSLKGFLKIFWESIFALLAPIIIIWGIVGGITTIVEASILICLYTLFVGVVIYRSVKLKDILNIFSRTAVFSSNVMILFSVIGIFSWVVANEQLGQIIANIIIQFDLGPYGFLLAINVLFLFLGMVIDAIPAMLIFFPVLLPTAINLGIDPTHFGVVVILNLMIGLNTPPVGALLFVESKISGVPFMKLTKATLPYTAALILLLALTTYLPSMVTFLPNLLMP